MTLDAVEFLRRFLLHVLPTGLVRIRQFGFLANRCRKHKLELCRTLLVARFPSAHLDGNHADDIPQDPQRCPICKLGRLLVSEFPAGIGIGIGIGIGNVFDNLSFPDYSDYRDRSRSFSGLAAHCAVPLSVTSDSTDRVRGDLVSDNYFDVLGVKPTIGRFLHPGDDAIAGVSFGMWRQKFGGNPGIAGMKIVLNGAPFTIVGVTESGFRGTSLNDSIDVWVPYRRNQ